MAKCLSDNYLLVVAIDFGTTYSGYAFSTRDEFNSDPLKICCNQAWNAGGRQLMSLKTPTFLLLDSNKKLIAFGYEAENRYAEIVEDEDEDHTKYYYFHRFKMNLHQTKNLSKELEIEDITGKKMLALEVFSLSIHALREHFIEKLRDQIQDVRMDDIRWVLTVPAIWSDGAKQFMRRSAEMAGIQSDKLIIALEPEAASIYCQNIPLKRSKEAEGGLAVFETGTIYMIVDMGGGTVDITVHETISDGKIREVCRAAGGNCGGASVDSAFLDMMEEITGKDVMNALRLDNMEEYLDLLKEFETKKRSITSKKTGKINMVVPITTLESLCKEHLRKDFRTAIQTSSFAPYVSVQKDKLRISVDTFRSLFEATIKCLIELVSNTLQHRKACEIEQILLVGGFSECELVQSALQDTFPQNKIIVPIDSGLAVLKGAVIYGHQPRIITERISKYTYGFGKRRSFDSAKHDVNHLEVIDGQEKCIHCFDVVVRKNEILPVGKIIYSKARSRPGDGMFNFRLYKSEREDPVYTDEDECSVLLDLPVKKENTTTPVNVEVALVFGDTEIGVAIVESKSGRPCTGIFDMI